MEGRPKFIKGIPEIGLPSLEPMTYSDFHFNEHNRHFKLSAMFTELYMSGLSDMTVENVKASGNINSGMTINLTISSPVFRCWGKWSGRGRAFQFNVNGAGKMDVNLTLTDFKLSIKGRAATNAKDGKKYFSVKSVDMDPVMRKAHVYISGLFPNDEHLTRMANKFVNRNMKLVLRMVKHYPKKYIGGEFEKIVKIVFNAWPVDQLMLD